MTTTIERSAYFHEGPKGVYREVTPLELAEAQAIAERRQNLEQQIADAKRELALLYQECPHTVVFDEAGEPYDMRVCVACGSCSSI